MVVQRTALKKGFPPKVKMGNLCQRTKPWWLEPTPCSDVMETIWSMVEALCGPDLYQFVAQHPSRTNGWETTFSSTHSVDCIYSKFLCTYLSNWRLLSPNSSDPSLSSVYISGIVSDNPDPLVLFTITNVSSTTHLSFPLYLSERAYSSLFRGISIGSLQNWPE